jgi:hypothetical protein
MGGSYRVVRGCHLGRSLSHLWCNQKPKALETWEFICGLYSTYQKFGNEREERREAYVKSRFSPRSQKIGFLTEGVEIFF